MRKEICLNENWKFIREDVGLPACLPADWQSITLPHTWNAIDGNNGKGEYYRGKCWYAKEFDTPELTEDGRVYLEFEAASITGRVFVNGKEIFYHEGGYSLFRADATAAVHESGKNLLAVCVDNTNYSHIYPQMADFTFYGGLYRGASMVVVPKTHFSLDFWGARGIRITAQPKENNTALIELASFVKSPSEDNTVQYEIADASGKIVAEAWRLSTDANAALLLENAHLWQGVDDPYLYTCTTRLIYRNEVRDEVITRFGVRSFTVDPEKGFFLNGKPMKLRGVSRHQDMLHKGSALTRADHYADAEIIRELGANTVRLAHYQHSADFYDACDAYGFVVWAEIPFISSMSDDPAAHENCRTQMQELVYQNYNHPSICFWGISNEITIAGEKPGVEENHRDLNELVKSIDATRLTTIAHVSMLPPDSGLHGITDVESYNHYFGWYGGTYDNNEAWLDSFHEKHPNICLGLSEYGAEGIITYQPETPVCRDYSEAYQAEYHEHMAKILDEREYLWSTHVWNMFDFGCAARDEGGVGGRNNKGLVTLDRKLKKEAFYIYKAYWSREPFVYICGRRNACRTGERTTIKVYSNQANVTLLVNGNEFASLAGKKIFVFENVPLNEGFTTISAQVGMCCDSISLQKVAVKPEIYTLPSEDDDDTDGVGNWFDQAAAQTPNANGGMEFIDGYFSVRDKIKDILSNQEATAVLTGAVRAMTGMKMKAGMLGMLGDRTLEGLAQMMGGMGNQKVPENAFQILNGMLNKIKK